MDIECAPTQLEFHALGRREVVGKFDERTVSWFTQFRLCPGNRVNGRERPQRDQSSFEVRPALSPFIHDFAGVVRFITTQVDYMCLNLIRSERFEKGGDGYRGAILIGNDQIESFICNRNKIEIQ